MRIGLGAQSSLSVEGVVTPDHADRLRSLLCVERGCRIAQALEQWFGPNAKQVDTQIIDDAEPCAIVQYDDRASHGRQDTSREDESLKFICDLSDLAAPAAISPVDERTVADQVSVTVVFVEGPLVARNVDSAGRTSTSTAHTPPGPTRR
jgi:hypothetical protein